MLEEVGGGGIHGLVATNVMLAGDGGVAVTEELRGKLESPDIVDRSGRGTTEPVRGDVFDAGLVHDIPQLTSDVIRRVRCSDTSCEQQRLRADETQSAGPGTDCA